MITIERKRSEAQKFFWHSVKPKSGVCTSVLQLFLLQNAFFPTSGNLIPVSSSFYPLFDTTR